jgi:hypothetical protein
MPQNLERKLVAAVRAELGRSCGLVEKKSYHRLVKEKRTLAYLTVGKTALGVHVRNGTGYKKLSVSSEDDIPAAVEAIRRVEEARAE